MRCQICGCDVETGGVVACGSCGAPFHRDCWEFNGGCGIYGCGGAEATAWEGAPPQGAELEIREGTAPAFRLAPHLERLVRRLPRWGRAVVPPVVVGLLDGLLMFGAVGVMAGGLYSLREGWPILVLALGGAVTVSLLSGITRKWPLRLLAASLVLCGGLLHAVHAVVARLGVDGALFVVLMCALVAATCVAELLVGRREAVRRLGGWRRALVEGVATTGAMLFVCLGVVLAVLAWTEGLRGPSAMIFIDSRFYIVVGLLSLLGFGAAAPAAALQASPLMHRLKLEAARESDDA